MRKTGHNPPQAVGALRTGLARFWARLDRRLNLKAKRWHWTCVLLLAAGQGFVLAGAIKTGWTLLLLGCGAYAVALRSPRGLTFLRMETVTTRLSDRDRDRVTRLLADDRVRLVLLLAAWAMVLTAILTYPNFQGSGPPFFPAHLGPSPGLWVVGLVLLALAFRSLPEPAGPRRDWGPLLAGSAMAVLLAVGAYFRFQRLGQPAGTYWDDWAIEIIDPMNLLDFGERLMVFPTGQREPFFSYFTGLVAHFMPGSSMLVIQRTSCALLDLTTIWVLYLLGKEWGGRRTGVMAAALAAISKPLVMKTLVGMRIVSLPLGIAAALLFFTRLMKKPDRRHFIQWALALAFGLYTYTAFRPWVIYLVLCSLAWVLAQPKERPRSPGGWAMVAFALLFWGYVFLDTGDALDRFRAIPGKVWWLVLLALAAAAFLLKGKTVPRAAPKAPSRLPAYWSASILLSLAAMVPLIIQPLALRRIQGMIHRGLEHPLKAGQGAFNLDSLGVFWHQALKSLKTLWIGGMERRDLGIQGDALFDFTTLAFFFLGLALVGSRRRWSRLFLAGGILVGVVTHFFPFDPHSGKLVGAAVPVILIGALGADRLLRAAESLPGRVPVLLLWGVLAVLWTGGAGTNFTRIYDDWYEAAENSNVSIAHQASLDSRTARVYLARYERDFANSPTQSVLSERASLHLMQDENPIFLRPGEPPPDVVVLYSKYTEDVPGRVRKDFPDARWSDVLRASWQKPEDVPIVGRAFIPASDLAEGPGRLFYIQRVPERVWTRKFYENRVGLARGVIRWEDRVVSLSEAIPASIVGLFSARITGSYLAEAEGKTTFSVKTPNYLVLYVDGKKVLDVRPHPRGKVFTDSVSVKLTQGEHAVEMLVHYQSERPTPAVLVQAPGSAQALPLDQVPSKGGASAGVFSQPASWSGSVGRRKSGKSWFGRR